MWHFRDFTHSHSNVNRFEIWTPTSASGYDYCKVVTYCQTEAGIRWASDVLYNLSMSTLTQPDYKSEIQMTSKKYNRVGLNHGKIEIAAVLNMSPEAVTAAMADVGVAPEAEKFTIEPGALSVGPCVYRDEEGTFAKVRFSGYSLPFYFDKENFLLGPTEKALTREVGGASAEAVFRVLLDNKAMLHKRAITRPLNLCKIGEYAQHNLKIMIGDGTGRFYSASKEEIAVPGSNLVTLFCYDYYDYFIVINEEVYKVGCFISGYGLAKGAPEAECMTSGFYNLDYNNKKGYIRLQDCTLIDPEDMFVREKIGRSIKAKL